MNGTPYRVRVRAKNTAGDSAWATASDTPAPLLVSNVGQTSFAVQTNLTGQSQAQGFTTGGNADGYTLEGIGIKLGIGATFTAADRGTVRAELWSSNSDGTPNAKTADLTAPSSMATGTVVFAAPVGTALAADTAYHVVLYSTGSLAAAKLQVPFTTSDDEDGGAAAGWSIANAFHNQARNVPQAQQTWTPDSSGSALQIRVNGTAVPPYSAPIWSATLTVRDLSRCQCLWLHHRRNGGGQQVQHGVDVDGRRLHALRHDLGGAQGIRNFFFSFRRKGPKSGCLYG